MNWSTIGILAALAGGLSILIGCGDLGRDTNPDDQERSFESCSGFESSEPFDQLQVLVRTPWGCADLAVYRAVDLDEAMSCANSDGFQPAESACWFTVREERIEGDYFATSADDAVSCAYNTSCSNCNWSYTGSYFGCVVQTQ